LIDCGIPAKTALDALLSRNIAPSSIDGILITHEHPDHINGAFAFSKRFDIPIYINPPTYKAAKRVSRGAKINLFNTGSVFHAGNTDIEAIPVPHDAADTVGFRISTSEGEIAHLTDLGRIPDYLPEKIHDARAVILEFNHDIEMLAKGPYPSFLKERIAGNNGHLSNDTAAGFFIATDTPNLEALFLAHLSRTNNLPKLALSAAQKAFDGNRPETKIIIADQFQQREIILP